MLISQNVKNLVSGISQQAPVLRLPEQLAEQVNGLSAESSGLTKRPPTVFIKSLMPALDHDEAPLLHFVDRDKDLKYFIYFYKNLVYVLDTNGKRYPVIYKDDPAYLETSTPQKTLSVITIADHTFIANKSIVTRMSNEKSPDSFSTQGGMIHVKQGQYGRTYQVWVNGKLVATHETPDGSDKSHTKQIDTSYISNALADLMVASGLKVTKGRGWVQIDGATSIETADGFNNQAMIGFTSTVQKFTLLPATAPNGYTVEITGDPKDDSTAGSYYVSYNATKKVWEECIKPDMAISYEAKTMPHELVRQSNDTFVFQRCSWANRECGDDDSNPLPSFINDTISDIAFHRNRLVLLSGENVICSESAEYFNFWMTTANDLIDTDPIDVSTTTARVNLLNYAIPFSGELYCFSDKSQFVLRADGVLSPKNATLVEVTEFDSNPDCRPMRAGRNIYFTAERAEYTSVKEYYSVQQVSDEKNAQDITSHVPDYIPNGVYQITSNTNENIMLFLTEGDKNCMYVYKYLFVNESRVQASWSKWDMGGRIFGAFFAGSVLYVLVNRGNMHCLEKMNFTTSKTPDFDGEPYRIYMDCKKVATTALYDVNTKTTTFNIYNEYAIETTKDISTMGVVLADGKYSTAEVKDGLLVLQGDYSTQKVIIGLPYQFHIQLSPIYRHSTKEQSIETTLTGRLQLRYIRLNYADTGGFTVSVKYGSGRECKYVMTARNIGENNAILGALPDATGIFKFPIQSLNTNVEINIDSILPLPLALIGFLWEGSFAARSRGV